MAKKQMVKRERVLEAVEPPKPTALDDAKTMAELVASIAATPEEERDGLAVFAATERIVGKV